MPSGRMPKSGHMGLYAVTDTNIVGQGTQPSSTLHTEGNVVIC